MWPFKKKAQTDTEGLRVITFLSPKDVRSIGVLPVKAIVGWLGNEEAISESFRPNPVFVDFLHHVIKVAGPCDPDLNEVALQQENGYVYIIDLRTPEGPQGAVPPEDIIGSFEVRSGKIIADSYSSNELHRVFTSNGVISLPPYFRETFIRLLKEEQEGVA